MNSGLCKWFYNDNRFFWEFISHEASADGSDISYLHIHGGRMHSSRWDRDVVIGSKEHRSLGTIILLDF